MKVLVVAPSLRTRGGITSVVLMHIETDTWREWNCEHLATHDDRGVPSKLWAALWSYLQAPFKIARADAVHLHMAGEISFMRKLPIAMMARFLRKPYIVHIHASGTESLFERTPTWATRSVFQHASRCVALSESWASAIRDHVPQAKVDVIANPVRIFRVREEPSGNMILFAGKLEPRKGYRTLLESVPAILKIHREAKIVFAGHGETVEAARIADEMGITASVTFLGWVQAAEMERLYREASVFCLPSRNEGVPMSVLTAMSHGVPVVCTPVGGLPEIIADGRTGVFCAVDDAKSLADGILTLLGDSSYARSIGAAGREAVQELCSIESVDQSLSRLYTEVAGRAYSAGTAFEQRT